jgi:putative ABC transport system substrate-binding protein
MTARINRRDVIALAGAAAWPIAARGQQPTMPVIGFLEAGSPEVLASRLPAFRKGLNEIGFVEGQSVAIEFRFAQNENDRLPELVAELVRRRVAVIVAPANMPSALAAKAATTTIPIVFSAGGDPVQAGVVASLNRPGGNVTGFTTMNIELGAKRVGLLHELLPKAMRFAVLVNSSNVSGAETTIKNAREGAAAIGAQIEVFTATSGREINTAFASIAKNHLDTVSIMPDALFANRRTQLVTLAVHHRVAAIYADRAFPEAGGLMSYGTSQSETYRQLGIYAGRILKEAKPADLPVMRATKFEFVINMETAMLLGIDVPAALLATADEVIE